MSIVYCHEHDLSWDSDYLDDCPQCIDNDICNEETDKEIQMGECVSREDLNKLWESKIKSKEVKK